MQVIIAGGRGRIARRVARLLLDRGHEPVALVRSEAGVRELARSGIPARVLDLERAAVEDAVPMLDDADAVVFSAGAGDPADLDRTDRVDRGGAAMCAEAAERAGVRRMLMVSAQGVELSRPQRGASESLSPISAYLGTKRAAELDLIRRDLDWTILRPGWLSDTEGTGRVRLGRSLLLGTVSRDDVAAVIVALLPLPASFRRIIELVEGHDTLEAALRSGLAPAAG